MTDTVPIKRERKASKYPVMVTKDGKTEISHSNIHETLKNINIQPSRSSNLARVVSIASIVNQKNISAIYREMHDIQHDDYDAFNQLGLTWWNLMYDIPEDADEKAYGNVENALSIGSSLASSMHIYLHKAYDTARYNELKTSPLNLVGQLYRFEKIYHDWLYMSRKAARFSDHELLEGLFHQIQHEAYGEFVDLHKSIGALSREDRNFKSIGLRSCQLARKMSFLLASCIYLRARLVRTSSKNGLIKIAESRDKLRRRTPSVRQNQRGLSGIKKLSPVMISTYVKHIEWIEEDTDTPYSFATDIDEKYEIRLHHKNMLRSGMSSGTWIWTKGKKEGTTEKPYVVAEFEGSGQHASTHWEDYLATELNNSYNLYPGSLHMEWEFPVIGKKGAINDLLSRTK